MAAGILWASPLPPVRSGVSDYAVELLPELARHARIRVVSPPQWQPPPDWALTGVVEVVPTDARPLPDEVTVLHLGNNPYHAWLLERLTSDRVVAVLHDAVLHHLLVQVSLALGDRATYRSWLESAYGERGGTLARAWLEGFQGHLDPFLFPARRVFLAGVRGVVVHSAWAAREVARDLPDTPVAHIGLAVADPGPIDPGALRARLGLDPDTVALMHLGFMTPAKGLNVILTGLAAARRCGVDASLVLVGENGLPGELRKDVAALGLAESIRETGWVTDHEVRRLPAAADLGVVLRTPSAGETSAAAGRFLACGTPVAVGGLRQFLEIPEAAAPRLTPGPAAAADLARVLASVASSRRDGSWALRRLAARAAYEARHRPDEAAAGLAEFVQRVA